MKAVLHVLLALLLASFLFFACSWQRKVGKVKCYLRERYEETFMVQYSLVEHWNATCGRMLRTGSSPMGDYGYESLTAHPKTDPNLRFTVSIESGVSFYDDYLDILIGRQYEEEFKRRLFVPDDHFRLVCKLNDFSWRFSPEGAIPKTLPELMELCQEYSQKCGEEEPALQVAVVLFANDGVQAEGFKKRGNALLNEWKQRGWGLVIVCFFVDQKQMGESKTWERETLFSEVYGSATSLRRDYPSAILSTAGLSSEVEEPVSTGEITDFLEL